MPRVTNQRKCHEDMRRAVCVGCLRPGCQRNIINQPVEKIQNFISNSDFNFEDESFPLGICNSCRMFMNRGDKSALDYTSLRSGFVCLNKKLRSNDKVCDCFICTKGRSKTFSRSRVNAVPKKTDKKSKAVCMSCFAEIGPGLPHNCQLGDRVNNVQTLLPPDLGQMVASEVIRTNLHPGGDKTVTLKNRKGPSLTVSVGASSSSQKSPPKVTFNTLDKLKCQLRLSDRGALSLAKSQRGIIGKKNVQSHYKSWLVRKSKDEESFFNITKVVVNDQAKEIVHVKDVQEYISHVIRCRGVDEDDCLIKIGGDTGGDYLKITMNIIDMKKLENPGSIPAGENENGVKKLKIIAIVYKGVENYNLVKAVLDLLNLPGIYLNWKATGDQKYINIVLGLQSHTASFPCPYCLTHKSFLTVNPEPRTFGHLRREAELSAEDQDPRSHFSVKNQPLLPFPDDTPVLSAVPPPELHLTLRSFNHVWNKMGTAWQQHLEETGEDLPWFSHPDPATQALDPASKFACITMWCPAVTTGML